MEPSATVSSGARTPRWCSRLHGGPCEARNDKHLVGEKTDSSAPNHSEQVRVFRWAERLGTSWTMKKDQPGLPQGRESLVHSKSWREASRAFFPQINQRPKTSRQGSGPGPPGFEARKCELGRAVGCSEPLCRCRGRGGLPPNSPAVSASRGDMCRGMV